MTTRHRLNRGGHRQANAALYRSVIVRMQHHQPTRAYVARRTAEGKTKAEIIRCLKRLLAREVWALMRPCGRSPQPPAPPLDSYRSVNALAETINGLYKTELIKARGPWKNVDDVEIATAEWVDWFNRRLYEYCGDMPPAELETAYYAHHQPQAAG